MELILKIDLALNDNENEKKGQPKKQEKQQSSEPQGDQAMDQPPPQLNHQSSHNAASKPEDTDTVRVILRCRPLSIQERERQDEKVVNVINHDEVAVTVPGAGGQAQRTFKFNKSVGPACKQADFFEASGIKTLLTSALDGYAATVFAYGQTGSGKTYSMSGVEERIAMEEWSGSDDTDGIIPRSIRFLFEQANSRQSSAHERERRTIRASYCEIYNEQVYDLLNLSSDCLPVRWNAKNGFFVQGLFVVECEEMADVMAVVSEGHRNRRVGSHELNKDSSRSHSLLTVYIETEQVDPEDGHATVKYGKIVFVDLAGSERLKDTKSEGAALTETGAINKSLFTLSKVISSLSDKRGNANKPGFIPYRDSKLTKLLMDSLGGNSLTLMIACCSPSSVYLDETISTMNYATRAKYIKNRPAVHVDPKEQLIVTLKQEIKLLRSENVYLRQQVGTDATQGNALASSMANAAPGAALPAYTAGVRSGVLSAAGSSAMAGSLHSTQSSDAIAHVGGVYAQGQRQQQQQQQSRRRNSVHGGAIAFPPPGLSQSAGAARASPSMRARQLTESTTGVDRSSSGGQVTSSMGFNESSLVGGVPSVMTDYQREMERLRHENNGLRSKSGHAERSYRAVMAENERLATKLEHLEEIFVHRGQGQTWPINDDRGKQATQQQQQQEQHPVTMAKSDAETVNGNMMRAIRGLTEENKTLKKQVKLLEHDVATSPKRTATPAGAIGEDGGSPNGGRPHDARLRMENLQLLQQVEILQRALWQERTAKGREEIAKGLHMRAGSPVMQM